MNDTYLTNESAEINCSFDPFDRQLSVYYHINQPTEILVEIYSVLGVKIYGEYIGRRESGSHQDMISLFNQGPGIYICVIQSNSKYREHSFTRAAKFIIYKN